MMQREIKFRQRNGDQWHYWGFGLPHGQFVGPVRLDTPSQQFTGLKDKNGTEIFEGDVLKYDSRDVIVIVWNQPKASFSLEKNGWLYSHFFGEAVDNDKCEVTGNIHSNPELLEASK